MAVGIGAWILPLYLFYIWNLFQNHTFISIILSAPEDVFLLREKEEMRERKGDSETKALM